MNNSDRASGSGLEIDSSSHPPVSMQLIQHVYREITGKSEKLEKYYTRPIQVSFADLEQLAIRMEQVCEQYSIQEKNSNITIYHKGGQRERFSSFSRFAVYNISRLEPTKEVVLEWNFLIVLPQTGAPQSYSLNVRLRSLVVEDRQRGIPKEILIIMHSAPTATVEVEYVDYIVARTMMDSVDEWVKSLEADRAKKLLDFLADDSAALIAVFKYCLLAAVAFSIYRVVPVFVDHPVPDFRVFARTLLICSLLLTTSIHLGGKIGGSAWWALKKMRPLSYIKLNRGDERAIREAEKRNTVGMVGFVVSVTLTFLLGVAASITANLLLVN